jgi:hypothetical protein
VSVLRTWPLTRGFFWRLLSSVLVAMVVPLVAGSGLVAMVASDQGGITPPTVLAPVPALFSGLVMGILYGAITTPLLTGVLAYFYRNIPPPAPRP